MPDIDLKDFDALYQQKKSLKKDRSGADHFNQQ